MLSCLRTIVARDVAALPSAQAPASVLSSPRYCLASRPALASSLARLRCPSPPASRAFHADVAAGLAVAASPADDATRAPASTTTAAAERAHAFPPPAANPRARRGEAERRTDSPPAAVRGGSATAIADRSEQTQTIAAQTAARGLSGLIAGPRPGHGRAGGGPRRLRDGQRDRVGRHQPERHARVADRQFAYVTWRLSQ